MLSFRCQCFLTFVNKFNTNFSILRSRGLVVLLAFLIGAVAGFFGSEYYRESMRPSQKSSGARQGIIISPSGKSKQNNSSQENAAQPELQAGTDTATAEQPPAAPEPEEMAEEVIASSDFEADSLAEGMADETPEDFIPEEEEATSIEADADIVVKKEQLLETRTVKNVLPPAKNLTDSVDAILEEHLSITPAISNQVVVEFWKSPVNFKGYKFNRKKLVLYGLSPQVDVKLCYYVHTQYMIVGDAIYKIVETAVYQPYQEVESETLKAHLRKYVG